jgi:hypothetical protein
MAVVLVKSIETFFADDNHKTFTKEEFLNAILDKLPKSYKGSLKPANLQILPPKAKKPQPIDDNGVVMDKPKTAIDMFLKGCEDLKTEMKKKSKGDTMTMAEKREFCVDLINSIDEKIDNQIELSDSEKENIGQYRKFEKTFLKKKKEYVAAALKIPFYQNNPYYLFDDNTMNWKKVKETKHSVKKTLQDSDDESDEQMVITKPKSKKTQKASDLNSDDEE